MATTLSLTEDLSVNVAPVFILIQASYNGTSISKKRAALSSRKAS